MGQGNLPGTWGMDHGDFFRLPLSPCGFSLEPLDPYKFSVAFQNLEFWL
jgi:hypothetical protein